MDKRNNKDLRRSVIKQIIVSCLMLFVQIIIFLISAGRINIPRAWVFFGVTFVYLLVSIAVLYKFNPELIKQRLKTKRHGSKLWDEVLMRAINLMVICVVPAIAGLDVGRFHWSNLSIYYAVVGLVLYIFSSVLINWAMIVNPHFEPTVRIQRDRDHQVITTGPYKTIRHPGYLAGILWTLSIPLIIGSVFAFIPAGIYALLTIIRTSLERSIKN
ncbi:MAG: methyltransferase family protein [Candidatus Bathyarchaeia archaeon]